MTTSRQAYAITPQRPGSDLAGETAAAMAAASLAFRSTNPSYADELLVHSRQVRLPFKANSADGVFSVNFSVGFNYLERVLVCLQ